MWTVDDPERWTRALGRSHHVAARIELWSAGQPVDEVPFVAGAVTDERKTGVRRSLSLTVPATKQWLRWLDMPALELRPYKGIRWTPRHPEGETCPMGRFPVLPPSRKLPNEPIQITADDYWQRVVDDNFGGPTQSFPGAVRSIVERLIEEAIGRPAVNTTTNGAYAGEQRVWDKSRHDTIVEYLTAIGAEAFVDREGTPVIQDYADGPLSGLVQVAQGGSMIAISREPNWSAVKNIVGSRSSAQDVDFGVAFAVISDPNHPAHPSRIGRRVMEFASPLLLTYGQGLASSQTLLAKNSALSESYSIDCIPDARKESGDLVPFTSAFGAKVGSIQKVTTPIGAGTQQITTGVLVA